MLTGHGRRIQIAAALASVAAATGAVGCGSVGAVTADEGNPAAGKQLFKDKCGGCHTLKDAGTPGNLGPNLDDAFRAVREQQGFNESTIRDVVRGQIAYPTEDPPTLENGKPAQGMPPNLVTGQAADDVAAYVASVAGLPTKGTTANEAANATDGKTIFTQNCGTCHTLAAAGTNGTIGPNLDQLKPDFPTAAKQVRNGGGGMPAFGGTLSDTQIKAVADFVSKSAGKK